MGMDVAVEAEDSKISLSSNSWDHSCSSSNQSSSSNNSNSSRDRMVGADTSTASLGPNTVPSTFASSASLLSMWTGGAFLH